MPGVRYVLPDRTPRRLGRREKVSRNAAVVASVHRGRSQRDVADEYGITDRQVRRILSTWEAALGESGWIDPIAELRAAIAMLRQAEADMAAIEEAPDNHAAHIGATRLKTEINERRINLMQVLGLLPRNLAAIPVEQQMQAMFRDFAETLRRNDVSDEVLEGMLELAERRLLLAPAVAA